MTLCFEVYESEALQFVRTARSPHDGEISGEVFREYRHGQASRELFFAAVSEAAEYAKRLRLPLVLDPSRDASPRRAEHDTMRSGITGCEEVLDDPYIWDLKPAGLSIDGGTLETNRVVYRVRRERFS